MQDPWNGEEEEVPHKVSWTSRKTMADLKLTFSLSLPTSNEVPAEIKMQGVTIIAQQKIPSSVSMLSHSLVPVDEVDDAGKYLTGYCCSYSSTCCALQMRVWMR